MKSLFLVLFVGIFLQIVSGYKAPNARIRLLRPKGFEVSIPAESGTTLFAFHGKLNEEFDGLESGQWSADINSPSGGKYVFRDDTTKLNKGDTLYFWTYVLNNGLGYRQDDGVFHV